jgi:hypothetical protein
MKRDVFKNEILNDDFNKNGYVIINHLENSIPERLQNIYEKHSIESVNSGFNTTHFSQNRKYKEEVLALAKDIFDKNIAELFNQYEVFFSNLMIKKANSNEVLPVHADWTYTDERKYTTISIWIPAINTTLDNGTLGIIPFSHNLYEEIRGPEIVSSYRKFDKILKEEKGVLLPISNHQAIIYDLRLLHFSLPNQSDDTRIAINITIKPKSAELIHYSGQGVEIFKFNQLDQNFFLKYNAHQIPEGTKPIEIIATVSQIQDQKIIDFYELHTKDQTSNTWKRILNTFKKKISVVLK